MDIYYVCVFIIFEHPWLNLLRSADNYLLSTQTQSLLCVYSCHPSIFTHFPLSFISLLALSLSRWLRALFSRVCFAPSFSFVSLSFPLLTGDSAGGGSRLQAGLHPREGASPVSAFSCCRVFVCDSFCLWCLLNQKLRLTATHTTFDSKPRGFKHS